MAELSKGEATTAKILAAAEELFVARNYADVTVAQVAEAAQVTKGAVYHHFSSKEQLYLAMLHTDLEAKRRLHEAGACREGSCWQRLRWLTEAFFALPRTKRDLIGLVRRDINIFPAPMRSELVQAYQRALPELVEQLVRDGIRDGEIMPTDPRLLAWHFIALVEVVLTPYAQQRFACDEDRLNYVMSLFTSGCSRRCEAQGENQ